MGVPESLKSLHEVSGALQGCTIGPQRCSRVLKRFQGCSCCVPEWVGGVAEDFRGVPESFKGVQGISMGFRGIPRVLKGFRGRSRVFQRHSRGLQGDSGVFQRNLEAFQA